VVRWAYNHPITALFAGVGAYVLTRWVRDRTRSWGYVPVITELGAVASYISTAFQYAIATGTLQRAIVNDLGRAGRDALDWLWKALEDMGEGVQSAFRWVATSPSATHAAHGLPQAFYGL